VSVVGGGSIEIKESREESNPQRPKEGRKEGNHPQFLMTGNMLCIYLHSFTKPFKYV